MAAEFALVRAAGRASRTSRRRGAEGAKTVAAQLDDISHYLAACQFGITLTSLGIGFLGEPSIANLIEPLFGGLSLGLRWRSRW